MDERINTSDREDIHLFSVVTSNTYYTANRWILQDLFEKSLRAKHGEYSPVDIQFEILREVIGAHSARQKYDERKGRFARAMKNLRRSGAPLEGIKRAQEHFQCMQHSAMAAKFFLSQLRSIGDGIAWRFFDYDRAALRLLAEHPYVSAPSLGTGLYAEVHECARLATQGRPFLLNSITNFLRFGDITVYDRATGTFKLVEVKAGKLRTYRTIRQAKQLALAQEGLEEGSHSGFSHTGVTRIICEKPLLTYAKVLEKVMAEAQQEQQCASSRVFGDYLSFAVFHTSRIIDLPQEDARRIQGDVMSRCHRICKGKSDVLLPIRCTNIIPASHFCRPLAPYTIFPIAPDLRLGLMTGEFLLFSQLNITGLERWLRKRGWTVRPVCLAPEIPAGEKVAYVPVLKIKKRNSRIGVEIPLDILALACMELWMPESIERAAEAILNQGIFGMANTAYAVDFPNIGERTWD